MSATFKWRDKEVINLCEENLAAIMAEFTLTAEGEAKKELQKGHGVVTGTLRRSIHGASVDYEFGKDDVAASSSSPERGGSKIEPVKKGNRFLTALGSGLKYAMKVHQGWGRFAGYHYITNGVDKAKGKLDAIVERHKV